MSAFMRSLNLAGRMLAGSPTDLLTGMIQGSTGTDHIQTGRPTLGGALGTQIGKSAAEYFSSPTRNPKYDPMKMHDLRTIPKPAVQIASTQSIGKQTPDLFLPPG